MVDLQELRLSFRESLLDLTTTCVNRVLRRALATGADRRRTLSYKHNKSKVLVRRLGGRGVIKRVGPEVVEARASPGVSSGEHISTRPYAQPTCAQFTIGVIAGLTLQLMKEGAYPE